MLNFLSDQTLSEILKITVKIVSYGQFQLIHYLVKIVIYQE